jgi:DNA repair protein RadD
VNVPILHPFQAAAITAIESVRDRGVRSLLMASPTGSGKTIIAGEFIRRENDAGRRVLFMAPRRELVTQAFDKLGRFGIVPGVLLAGDKRQNLMAMTQVASVDTLRSRVKRLAFPDPHTIIVDECHCYVTRARTELIARWPQTFILGLTATPDRRDGRGLRLLFDQLIEIATTEELTRLGFLVPARYFSIAEPDLRGLHILAGDYQQDELAARVAPLVGDIPRTWLERAPGRRTVVFAVNVKHSMRAVS